ncbi:MAG: HAD family hydrolase [Ruminococcus sp.]|nr:HAD family hydrolase [Ruminococcus sp.]
MPSVIFFDIDGTLITEDARMLIPESTRRAIARTRELGNLTFINSGRTEFNILPKIRELGFDGYLLGCGTYIEYAGQVLLYETQPQEFCRRIAQVLLSCGVTPVYERRDGYFFEDRAPMSDDLKWFLDNFVSAGIDVSRRVPDPDFSFDKFVVWENPGCDMELFRSEIGRYFDIIDRGGGFYENVPKGFSKATAITAILDRLGIELENAYAIGDSPNDLPMLEAVPHSIAMGGAERIHPYVSYITDPIEEDGIWNALEHFGLV